LLVMQGFLLCILALFQAFPIAYAVAEHHVRWQGFVWSAVITLGSGVACLAFGRIRPFHLSVRQLFAATTLSWLMIGVFSALPFLLAIETMSVTDAVFESVSGLTTTGSTVLTNLEHMPHSILLWRGIIQWLGGIGIIVLAIAVLPFLRVGGMRLFQTESSDWSQKIMPRTHGVIRAIGTVYLGLTLAAIACYWLAGMSGFDALVHAMTTVATGGFSNYDASFGVYHDNVAILWLTSLFMVLAALPFILYVRMTGGDRVALFRDQQVRGYFALILVLVSLVTLDRSVFEHAQWFSALTHTVFNVVSVITTTGYASEDYMLWGEFSVMAIFFVTFIGGCSGSTGGGIKMFRFQIGALMLWNQIRLMVHPHAVVANRYNGNIIGEDVVRSVVAFAFFFALTVVAIALALSLMEIDIVTSLSGAATAVANVGPGLGHIIGPAGNFASLPDAAKWVLAAGMLLGRLEILTVLILFSPVFWRG